MTHVPSIEIPQADRLEAVRAVVLGVSQGVTNYEGLSEVAGLSERHVKYYLQAARILGFLKLKPRLEVRESGRDLLATSVGSSEEAAVIVRGIRLCPHLRSTVGDFLRDETSREALADRLMAATDLSKSTAVRRAGTLVAWRHYLGGRISLSESPVDTGGTAVPKDDAPNEPSVTKRDLISPQTLQLLQSQMARARLVLLTGAGFSSGATDCSGKPLPLGRQLAIELWDIAFPGQAYDEYSELGEIYAVALKRNRPALQHHLATRLTVDPGSLPEYYNAWLRCPWRKVYTLNQDNLELASDVRFGLPRSPKSISALTERHHSSAFDLRQLAVIHLNGCLSDGAEKLTFSPPQYGQRHAHHDAAYAELASDFLAYSVVLVGTALDESVLWHHIELREARLSRAAREFRPRSFLVCPSLSIAKQSLLEQYKITWINATAEQFAEGVISLLSAQASKGHEVLKEEAKANSDAPSNVSAVSDLVAQPPMGRTEYLLGEHPQWADLTQNRAIRRTSDKEIQELCRLSAKSAPCNRIVLLTGTGGAGKSTSLMRVALTLSAAGEAVAWVGTGTEASPSSLGEVAENGDFSVFAIDDLDRYGRAIPSLLRQVCLAAQVRLVVASLRASKVDVAVDSASLGDVEVVQYPIPHMSDSDIEGVIDVLTREHRLGKLKGLERDAQRGRLREKAGRQMLVALIEATSGERFEEKVYVEWSELPAQHRQAYAMIAIAGALGLSLSKNELLLACGASDGIETAEALTQLSNRRIIVFDAVTNQFRPRHRLIAETLLSEIAGAGQDLTGVHENLAFAVSSSVSPDSSPTSRPRRLLKIILNHEYLFRRTDVEGGRRVYDAVEENLSWDHHYWLQRGMLELQEGYVKFAEQCINQARGLNPDDPYVDTAYAHMLLKKAIANPGATDADEWVSQSVEILNSQIQIRGSRDFYPFHVLGSQGIAWFGKAPWPTERRKSFLDNIYRKVQAGAKLFPRNAGMQQLEQDVLKALLGLQVR